VFDKLSRLDAGESARLLIDRAGKHMTVSVRLGSLMNALGQFVPEKNYAIDAL